MSQKAPYFPLYVNDWLGSTNISLMTPEQEGAYIRLLCHAWGAADCGLPNDDSQLAILSRLGEGWLNGASTVVKGCFKVRGKRLYNDRLLAERKKQEIWSQKSRLGGKKSAKARKDRQNSIKGGSSLVPRVVDVWLQPKGNSSSSSSSSSLDLVCSKEHTRPSDAGDRVEKPPETKKKTSVQPNLVLEPGCNAPKKTTWADIQNRWNRIVEGTGLPKLQVMSDTRKDNYRKTVRKFPDFWNVLYREIPLLNDFALGDSDRGWKLDFDYLTTRRMGFVKLLEGRYRREDGEVRFSDGQRPGSSAPRMNTQEYRDKVEGIVRDPKTGKPKYQNPEDDPWTAGPEFDEYRRILKEQDGHNPETASAEPGK